MTSARGLAFTAAHRMVDRVHADAAVVRHLAQPALPARLAAELLDVVAVSDHAVRRAAIEVPLAQFARGQTTLTPGAFLGHKLRARAGGARELAAAADLELDVVNAGANGDVPQRER